MKYIDNRNDFIKSKNNDNQKLFEDSGPFANDLGWHDSLLGRFINHLIRKGQIKYRSAKIKDLTKRLEETFDAIITENSISSLDDNSKEMVKKITLYSIFHDLKESVEKGEEVSLIKDLTQKAIDTLKSGELSDQLGEFKEKDQLLSELEEFKKFLDQFDDENKEGEGKEGEGKEGESKEGESKEGELSSGQVYALMIKNLTSLSHILSNYEKVNLGNISKDKEDTESKKHEYTTKDGDTFQKIQANTKANIKKLDIATIRQKNPKVSKVYADDNQTMKPGLVLVMESMSLLENKFGTGGSKDRANIKSGEDHLTQAFIKLKKDIEVLKSSKEKGIGIDVNFLSEIVKGKNDSTNKEYIRSLYRDIKRYLVGDAKETIQEKDPLYKESIEFISDKRKRMVVAEKIARFSKRAMQFKGTGLEGGLGDLKKPLQDFISSMEIILKSDISVKEEPKKEEVKESKLFRYNRFVSYIKEAEENTSDREATMEPETISSKIKDFFDKNCKGVKSFVIEKTEVDKINKNLEEIEKEKEKSKKFVINGMDPVIEIVKLFNKAYKLFTFPYMTKRTAASGGVGVTTAGQYTALGGASDDGRKGPYRNNEVFDIWENAVNDIFKNKKYQHIFLPTTTMRIPNVPNPKGPKDYDIREKAGANLRKFMLDILDGENLYKTTSEGKQKDFINKYFGEVDEGTAGKLQKTGDTDSTKLQKEESEVTKTEIKFSNIDSVKNEMKVGLIFSMKGLNKDNKDVQRFFLIKEISNASVYLIMSNSFVRLKKYIDRLDGKIKFERGDFTDASIRIDSGARYTRIKQSEFESILKKGKISITSIDSTKEPKEDVISVTNLYWLTTGKEGEISIFNTASNEKQLNSIIEQLDDKYKLESLIDSAPNSDSIKITKL